MRGMHGRRRRDEADQAEGPGHAAAADAQAPSGPEPAAGSDGAAGGYLSGAYPASPPPADAPVTGPDPDSADPYYHRPDYPTDPGGVPLPDLGEGKPSGSD